MLYKNAFEVTSKGKERNKKCIHSKGETKVAQKQKSKKKKG